LDIGIDGQRGDIVEIVPPSSNSNNDVACVQPLDCNKLPNWLWARNPDTSTNFEDGLGISVDCLGNLYVTGNFCGTVTFSSDTITCLDPTGLVSTDIFVAKLDSDGNWLWARNPDMSTNSESGNAISVDCDGNAFVTGFFNGTATFGTTVITAADSDIFVAKIDKDGNWLWIESAGPGSQIGPFTSDRGNGISVDCDGNAYITGQFGGTVTFGNHVITSNNPTSTLDSDIFVAKIDWDGNWLWAISAGGRADDVGNAISVDCKNNAYVTGSFRHQATFGSHIITSDSNLDIFVAKVDSDGNWLWASSAGSPNVDDVGKGIVVDCKGNSYVTGYFQDTSTFGSNVITSMGRKDIFVAKIDTNGNWLWARGAGDVADDSGLAVSVDCEGNAYATGFFSGTVTFGPHTLTASGANDVFVAKLNCDGDWIWVKNPDMSTSFEEGKGITVDCYGNVYITGQFNGTATFGPDTIVSAPDANIEDVFVAKIASTHTNYGAVGFLKNNVKPGKNVEVCFPGGVTLENTFNQDLLPGHKYYLDCKCKLSTCCKCAKQFIGIACDKDRMLTGIKDNCCTNK
jgi:hypothetical protein